MALASHDYNVYARVFVLKHAVGFVAFVVWLSKPCREAMVSVSSLAEMVPAM